MLKAIFKCLLFSTKKKQVCKAIFKCLLFSTKSSRTRSKEPRSQGSLSTKYQIPLQQEVRTPKATPNWGIIGVVGGAGKETWPCVKISWNLEIQPISSFGAFIWPISSFGALKSRRTLLHKLKWKGDMMALSIFGSKSQSECSRWPWTKQWNSQPHIWIRKWTPYRNVRNRQNAIVWAHIHLERRNGTRTFLRDANTLWPLANK